MASTNKFIVYDPRPASKEEVENYHNSDYIDLLSRSVTPNHDQQPPGQNFMRQMIDNFNYVGDCPIFGDI